MCVAYIRTEAKATCIWSMASSPPVNKREPTNLNAAAPKRPMDVAPVVFPKLYDA
jgi:hypothetical protein